MIGEGAFGKVHEGKWRGKSVAVKLLICQDLRSDILNEFQSEVEIMSVLRHPIFADFWVHAWTTHRALVVELLQRGSLWGVLRHVVSDHFERPILHRDLKSPNLLAHVQTMTGNCGTVQWMAPEVLGNQKYTEKQMSFHLGLSFGNCDRRVPYDGMSQIQAALGVLNRNLRPNIPRDCPPFFSRL
ncbi:putative protein kinase [Plasmopara halstedii]